MLQVCFSTLTRLTFMIFLSELKQATAALHQQTEDTLYANQIMGGTLSLAQYTHLLLTHFQFHATLENELEKRNFGTVLTDFDSRRKLPALQKDLQEINIAPPTFSDQFSDWSYGQLLGAYYVGEGSTLGGKVIEKHLRKSVALQAIPKFYFYGVYGDSTGEKWKAFLQFLIEQAPSQETQIIQGADNAFRLFQTIATHTPV